MDIMQGKVVHAIGGKREQYRPIKSIICSTSNPIVIAKAFKNIFDFNELYIADLDAIMGKGDNLKVISKICNETNMKVMLDFGIDNNSNVNELFNLGVSKVVVGTETLTTIKYLNDLIKNFGKERIIPSIDSINGKVISKCLDLNGMDPLIIALKLESIGVSELILLDISKVGTESGVNIELVKKILSSISIPILIGGGIRSINDIQYLKELGVSGVLIATALHKGIIKKSDIERIKGF